VGEPQMVQVTLDLFDFSAQSERLVGDKAYGRDELDETWAELGIERITPRRG
jgi:hypothetical protein